MPLSTSNPRTARSDTHIVVAQCTHDVTTSAQDDASSSSASSQATSAEEEEAHVSLANGTLRLSFSVGVKLASKKRRRNAQPRRERPGARAQPQQREGVEESDEQQSSQRMLTARELLASGVWSLIMDFLARNSQVMCLRNAQVVQPSTRTDSNEVVVLLVSDQSGHQDSQSSAASTQVLNGIHIRLLCAAKDMSSASGSPEDLHSALIEPMLNATLQNLFRVLLPRLFTKDLITRYGALFNGAYIRRKRELDYPLSSLATSLASLLVHASTRRPNGEHAQQLELLRARLGRTHEEEEEESQPLPRRVLPPVVQNVHVRAASAAAQPASQSTCFARAATGPQQRLSQKEPMKVEVARNVVLRSLKELDRAVYPPQKIKTRLQQPCALSDGTGASPPATATQQPVEAVQMDIDASSHDDEATSDADAETQRNAPSQPNRMPDFIEPLRPSSALLARMAGRGMQASSNDINRSSSRNASGESSPLSSAPTLSQGQGSPPDVQPGGLMSFRAYDDDLLLDELIWTSDEEASTQQHQQQRAYASPGDQVMLEELIWTSDEEAALELRGQQQRDALHASPSVEATLDDLLWTSDEEASVESSYKQQQSSSFDQRQSPVQHQQRNESVPNQQSWREDVTLDDLMERG